MPGGQPGTDLRNLTGPYTNRDPRTKFEFRTCQRLMDADHSVLRVQCERIMDT
jgi:hypothetical protein